jgi:hypothetical protein
MKNQLFNIAFFVVMFAFVYWKEEDILLSLIVATFFVGLAEIIVAVFVILIWLLMWSLDQLYSSKADSK